MNKVILMGRLTRDPDIRYSQGENNMAIARYTLAVDRRFQRNSDQTADFAEKYLKKGVKIAVTGRIQTGSYTNKDGAKVYTTDVIVEDQEFAESKNASQSNIGDGGYSGQDVPHPTPSAASGDGFMTVPDGVEDQLPFQ